MNWYKIAQNSLQPVTIRTESIGSHHGQSDMIMIASLNDNNVGTLEFTIFNDEPYVNMIKVKEEYRRRGIATLLMKELQKKFPDTEIHIGMTMPEGNKLIESIPSKFTPNKRYNELLSEKNKLQTRIDQLQSFLDTADPKIQRSDMLNKGEEWNIVRDRLYDIEKEIQGLTSGKNILETL